MVDSINNPGIFQSYTVGIKNEGEGYDASYQWKGSEEQTTYDFILGLNSRGVKNAYSGFLEVYDGMLKKWFKGFEILDAANQDVIPVTNITYGVPERLFSANQKEGVGNMMGRINLPAISFVRTDSTRVVNRGPTLAISHKRRVWFDDLTKKFVESKGVHKQMDLKYTVNFWTKYQQELQMLTEQFLLPFQPDFYFSIYAPQIDFAEVIRCHFDNTIAQTSLIAAADTERMVRASATFTLEAYLPTLPSRVEKSITSVFLQKKASEAVASSTTTTEELRELVTIEKLYTHEQDTASTTWTIAYAPTTTQHLVVWDANSDVVPEANYTLTNYVTYFTLTFTEATAGKVDIMTEIITYG
jgi:hypothetical protein